MLNDPALETRTFFAITREFGEAAYPFSDASVRFLVFQIERSSSVRVAPNFKWSVNGMSFAGNCKDLRCSAHRPTGNRTERASNPSTSIVNPAGWFGILREWWKE